MTEYAVLRSLSLGTSGIGIERIGLSKKGSVKARGWTERVIVIEIQLLKMTNSNN